MHDFTGVLLVNLGTPNSPSPQDVYRYLIEFLSDGRVIDSSWLWRQILVRGFIVPFRYKQSAALYQQLWTAEGSPLMVYGLKVKALLQETLGKNFQVELAMRYQQPSIQSALDSLTRAKVNQIVVLPLFPQYASATTGSVLQKVTEILNSYQVIPKTTLINQYATHPHMIAAFCEIAKDYPLSNYDHILFSFHGLPQRHILKADCHGHCLKKRQCCQTLSATNQNCYSAQCHATMQSIANMLELSSEKYSICFQSRLGKDPWLQPYAAETIRTLAKQGKKRVLVFCPAFVCDCLETTIEIGIEYAQEFRHAGGERLDLVRGLNDHPLWIAALRDLVWQEVGSQTSKIAHSINSN